MVTALDNDPLLKSIPVVEGWKVLAPVVLYAKIGQGGMGSVYRGRHLDFDIDVAVKCLKPSLAAEDEQFIQRFRREARLAAGLTHENLVRVYDYRRAHGLHYLVMEFVDGETARDRVARKGALDEHEAATIILGAARGLAKAHRNEETIVHRDVKPENILISRRGEVKLADLGIAKALERDDGATFNTQGVLGTPQYMAPEQWERDQALGPPADVWSCGATLYFLLTGENAIRAGSERQVYVDVCQKPFPDVRDKRPEVSAALREILKKCMQREMRERYADAGELAEALAGFIGQASTSLVDPDTGTQRTIALVSPPPMPTMQLIRKQVDIASDASITPPQSRTVVMGRSKARWWWTGAGLALASIAVALGVRFWPSSAPPVQPQATADVTPPKLSLENPADNSEVESGSSVALSLDFDEDLASARAEGKEALKIVGGRAEFELDAPGGERPWTVRYDVSDRAGNHTEGKLLYVCKLKPKPPAPRIALTLPDLTDDVVYLTGESLAIRGLVENPAGTTIRVFSDDKPVEYALEANGKIKIDHPIRRDTTSRIRLECGGEPLEFTAVQDFTDPSIAIVEPAPESAYTNGQTVDIVARVADTNLAKVQLDGRDMLDAGGGLFRVDKLRLMREGDNSFEIVATDRAGRAPKYRLVITRDQQYPALANANRPEGSELEQGSLVKLVLTFNEPLLSARIANQDALLDGQTAEVSVTVPKDKETWDVQYEVVDLAKNVTARSLTYKCKFKAAPPAAVIRRKQPQIPEAGLYLVETKFELRGTIENPTDAQLSLTVNELVAACTLENGEFSATLPLPANRSSKIELKYGNAAPDSFVVIQDSKDPFITPTQPPGDGQLTKERTIDVTVSVDDQNLENVLIGGRDMQSTDRLSWHAAGVDLPVEGANSLQITAKDKANRTAKHTLTITRDTIRPKLLAESEPKQGTEFVPGTTLRARLVFDEPIEKLVTPSGEQPASGREAQFLVEVPQGTGPWTIQGDARDLAGNLGPFELKLARAATPEPPKPVGPTSKPEAIPLTLPSAPEGWIVLENAKTGRWASKVQEPRSGIVFVLIAPGKFMMGSPGIEPERDGGTTEQQHQVELTRPFYLAETETTQLQYKKVIGKSPSDFRGDELPVEGVSWNDANAFCAKIGCDLPSEAQWEYACRAGTTTAFSFGRTISSREVNFNGSFTYDGGPKSQDLGKTSRVKSYRPNPWGLYDMHGNVWEWCLDGFGPNAYTSLANIKDPVFNPKIRDHVLRGGTWSEMPSSCRSAKRFKAAVDAKDNVAGFRCAKTLGM